MYHHESAAWTKTIMSKYCRIPWNMSINDSNCGVPVVSRQLALQLRVTYLGLRLIDSAATVYAAQSWSSSNSKLELGSLLNLTFGFRVCVCFERSCWTDRRQNERQAAGRLTIGLID